MVEVQKRCRRCGEAKALSAFPKAATCRDGHRRVCKSCARAQLQARLAVRPTVPALPKQCHRCGRVKAPEAFPESARCIDGHRNVCKACRKAQNKEWSEANPERDKARRRRWLESRGIDPTAYVRQWRAEHPEQDRANNRRSRLARRLRKMSASGSHTEREWLELVGRCMHSCMGCGRQLPLNDLTQDHITPLSKGGGDEIENILPLCGSCNSRKGTRGVEWYAEQWAAMELPAAFECLAPCPWVFGDMVTVA